MAAEACRDPDRALAANCRSLDSVAFAHDREQRNHAVMGKIDLLDRLAGFLQDHALLEMRLFEMSATAKRNPPPATSARRRFFPSETV